MSEDARPSGRITAEDAIQLWIARAARVRIRELTERYGVDARRLYEVWREDRFAGARAEAIARLEREGSPLAQSVRLLPHVSLPRGCEEGQMELFSGAS
ncbi:MAG: hypothetical protein KDJ41_04585 [Hyphomicrobiaceae bacterium]|nr:hypothetical protein [Hyphomicrobiaceae bacterium]